MLKVVAIQADLVWEDPVVNRAFFEKEFQKLDGQNVDLVVLPEMFTTGFSMQIEKLSETMNGTTVTWLKESALRYNFLLTGSIIIKEDKHFFNRQLFVFPSGEIQYYDKRHLFRMGNEHKYYTAGKQRIVIEYKNWRILPQICYDLRFPVWSRNRNDYDLLIYIANFPTPRQIAWNTLLTARAIENQCYVIGCNRVGEDANGLRYNGDSQIISPKGNIITKANPNTSCSIIATLSLSDLENFRKKFPVYTDSDCFSLDLNI